MENLAIHVITKREQAIIQALLDSGALNVKNGSSTLHFDNLGTLKSIEVKAIAWKLDMKREVPYNA